MGPFPPKVSQMNIYPSPCDSTSEFWAWEAACVANNRGFPPFCEMYLTDTDYVGPQGSGVLSTLANRSPYGVDVNRAAYRHDIHYAVGGTAQTRRHADTTFLREMQDALVARYPKGSGPWTAFRRFLANRRLLKYWKLVRAFGQNFYNFHNKVTPSCT